MKLDKPDQWSESNLVPILKSGYRSQLSNYRGKSLSQVILEVGSCQQNDIKSYSAHPRPVATDKPEWFQA